MENTIFDAFVYSFNSPVGVISVTYAPDPFVLTRVILPGKDGGNIVPIPDVAPRPPETEAVKRIDRFFSAYFDRRPVHPPWTLLQIDGFSSLERLVYDKTAAIAFGETAAYSAVAKAIGRPGASRFVGNALAKNPFPIIIPCHRVIRKDGGLGGFGSGLGMKKKLLAFEGCAV